MVIVALTLEGLSMSSINPLPKSFSRGNGPIIGWRDASLSVERLSEVISATTLIVIFQGGLETFLCLDCSLTSLISFVDQVFFLNL